MTLRTYLTVAAVVILMATGWWLRGIYEDSKDLAALEAQQAAEEKYEARESKVAKLVEERLAELKANERVIEREKLKLVERPVYRSDCVDADGLHLLGRMARGGDAEKPSGEVPGGAAGADGKDGR